ncbi:MAG: hypothetical protein JXB62_17305 [Pirellulales bacterium]|nr:hypothetical protein [Pirellulales bacterium]
MVGAITTWDVLLHPVATVQCFGWRIFFRAVFPLQRTTFLSLLQNADFFVAAAAKSPVILGRCIGLELRAKRIYAAFAKALADDPVETGSASRFFHTLAEQEQEHADLLAVCRAVAIRGGWKADYLSPWQDCVDRLEQQMEQAEASVASIGSVEDALRLVIRIESSEINQTFQAVLAAADSPLVKRLGAFRGAMETHTAYICRRIPELAPHLTLACRELRLASRFSTRY